MLIPDDGYGNYLLMFAHYNINIFKLLLENGADINKDGRYGSVLTDYIYENGDDVSFEYIQFLIDSGADINYEGNNQYTPLMQAIISGTIYRLELIKFLLDKGANNFEFYEEDNGYNAIHFAVNIGSSYKNNIENEVYQIVKLLVDAGANVNARTSEYSEYSNAGYQDEERGLTPLMFAIQRNHISVVNFLLQNGADIYI